MVIKNVNLETVCGITSTLPENQHPEVAFSGKSNVGKSSLINGLMNRKAYARVSQQPGKTQTINYYNVNDEIYIVDLPGYGFANVKGVYADEAYMDEKGKFDLIKAKPIVYSHGQYYGLGRYIGKFGYSVQKNPAKVKKASVHKTKANNKKA